MVDSLEALKTFDRARAASTQDNKQITRRTELIEDAAERVYFVIIQREAMNLPCYGMRTQEFEQGGVAFGVVGEGVGFSGEVQCFSASRTVPL